MVKTTAPVIVQEMTTRSFCEVGRSIEMKSLAHLFPFPNLIDSEIPSSTSMIQFQTERVATRQCACSTCPSCSFSPPACQTPDAS